MMPLVGSVVELRPACTDDVGPAYVRWMNDPEVTRFLESRFRSWDERELVAYVEGVVADPDVHMFGIWLREEDEHVGNIKIGPLVPAHRRGDIGLLIGEPTAWGRGVGTESIELLSRWAFDELGLAKITAGAYAKNGGSVRAFEKAGFEIEARLVRHYLDGDDWDDGILLARFASR
jgi:ribosomal-protein-alanine N-acetyltransferase